MGELGVVGPLRAAVWDEESGVFLAGGVVEGFVEVAGDLGAVFRFEVDVFAVGELELGEEGVVDVGELGEFALSGKVDFVGAVDGGHLDGDGTAWDVARGAAANRIGTHEDGAWNGAGAEFSVAKGDGAILRVESV